MQVSMPLFVSDDESIQFCCGGLLSCQFPEGEFLRITFAHACRGCRAASAELSKIGAA
jgi:hypothetical protein